MKKILALSDIHFPSRLEIFPHEKIKGYADKVDYIFGLGDYDTEKGFDYLYDFGKEVHAVAGNMDDYSLKIKLPSILRIRIEETDVGLIHGWGSHFNLRERISKQIDDVDLICYGHSHAPYFNKEHNMHFFNPGSIAGTNPTFGILTIDKNKIKADIIELNK